MSRLVLAALLAAIGEFCILGFLASFEPGNSLWYRVIYFVLGVLALATAMFVALSSLATRRSVRTSAVIGTCAGGIGAFVLVCPCVLSGFGGDAPWRFGFSYATLAAPLGAIIGGTLGVWVGLRGAHSEAAGTRQSVERHPTM